MDLAVNSGPNSGRQHLFSAQQRANVVPNSGFFTSIMVCRGKSDIWRSNVPSMGRTLALLLPIRNLQRVRYCARTGKCSAGRQYWCPHWHMSGMITMFCTDLPVPVPYWLSVLAFSTGVVLAYVGHDNDFQHWQTSAGSVLVVHNLKLIQETSS